MARTSETWLALGALATELGDDEGAEYAYRRSLRGNMVAGRVEAGLVGLAQTKARAGADGEAAALLGVVLARVNVMRFVREEAEEAMACLRSRLPQEEWQAAVALAQRTSLNEAAQRWAL